MYNINASLPSRGKGALRGDCVRYVMGRYCLAEAALLFIFFLDSVFEE